MSSYGWTYLSRDALRRAERQLSGAGEDVRDEIGFLILHQRYADYFFPGTSVLHTRLRYALFVPWIYQTLYEDSSPGLARDRVQRAEVALAGRLNQTSKGDGVIGGLNYPRPTSQPASSSYWGALGTWGILREQNGRLPSRANVHALVQSKRKAVDDDGHALARLELPFVALPPRPTNWVGLGPLDFRLLPREATFLHARLSDLRPVRLPKQLSLLARLADGEPVEANNCWESGLIELAKEDGPKLRRAGCAASLAAVGRAVYAALVETLREEADHQPSGRKHREYLPAILNKRGAAASRVSVGELLQDTGPVPRELVEVLEQTLAWLKSGSTNPMTLRDAYENAECKRKNQRARLSRLFGAARRMEWIGDEHPLATPLHYRWHQVSRLLHDLWAAA